ncbi:Transposon Ty3-I Gag-Pol poly [Paramuricea clavata]|uniref:Transposon Ty3-I Gag-Pol poly n=1 Tax=Paramuricea clavata TaxID=317549 RepID=A0A6S7IQZ7_PARCT|nr:Transposon Ty3-I Gag-Pol poly [Paramuricea clavata]
MANVLDLPAIPPFSVSETNSLAQRWEKWTNSLDYYIRASGISDQKQKRAILLHLVGSEVQEIFETLPDTGEDYKTALEKLNAHFNPCKNIAFERHVFRQATQRADESMDAFVTRLRTLAKTCQFDKGLSPKDQQTERENARQLEQSDDDSSENECLFTLTAHNVHHRSDSLHMLEIEHIPVQMLIDSGASVNVLDLETYHRLKARKGVQLMPSTLRVYAYGSTTPLNILGTVSGRVKCNSAEIVAKFVVVHDQHAGCLLGRQTATQLGLLRVGPQVSSINCTVSPHSLRQRYPSVFDGVEKLTNYQQKISINTNIKPVAQPPRRIPFHVRKQVSAKLEELERLDIIEEVRGPTPWVSPLVVVPKSSGEIRVCVDMRQVNTAVIRERYPIPTVEESLQDLNGAAVFSKLDLKWGYHQIELDEQSRELATFTTHDGLYRYKRLMFGISAAPEIYQHICYPTSSTRSTGGHEHLG